MLERSSQRPNVFISYPRGDAELSRWVRQLVKDLRVTGLEVLFDEDSNTPGGPLAPFMVDSVRAADWILCVCAPAYVAKVNDTSNTGLRYEVQHIADWHRSHEKKLIPLLRTGTEDTSIPGFAKGPLYLDFRKDEDYDAMLNQLLKAMESTPPESTTSSLQMDTGMFLIADVIDFSDIDGEDQPRIIQSLWKCVDTIQNSPLPELKKIQWGGIFPLLDGIGIIWSYPAAYKAVLETAERLQNLMRTLEPTTGIRIGINFGQYARLPDNHRPEHFLGDGLNDAYRAACLGGAGHIILTDSFVNACRGQNRRALQGKIHPPLEESSGFEVFSKRATAGCVRLYGTMRDTPRRIMIRDIAGQQLECLVAEIAAAFSEIMEERFLIPKEELNARATIWAADPVSQNPERELRATDYRHFWNWEDYEDQAGVTKPERSQTTYSLANDGEGPPSKAWLDPDGMPKVAIHLPDPEENLQAYAAVLRDRWNIPEGKVRGFGRKARSFICFTFPCFDNDKKSLAVEPHGVVCLDCASSLFEMQEMDLVSIADELSSYFSRELTLVWEHRV